MPTAPKENNKKTESNSQRRGTRAFPDDYALEIVQTIYAMTLPRPRTVNIAGTQAMRIVRHSADYDAISTYNITDYDDAAYDFQQMIERLISTPNFVIGDIKIGEIPRWKV